MNVSFTVYIRKPGGPIISQYFEQLDQAKRWKKLAIDNGYEIVRGKQIGASK